MPLPSWLPNWGWQTRLPTGKTIGAQLPDLNLDEDRRFDLCKRLSLTTSRTAISPTPCRSIRSALIDWSQGEKSQEIIKATLKKLQDFGPDYWCGYSYSWFGNMKARAFDGEGAADALRTFAECFCLPNTFHANGDQTKSGKSKFTYRPFTLEGNFAFAAGIQEMLLQSHTGVIRVFPAVPVAWQDVSFDKLRAMGAFLVSAEKVAGQVRQVRILPEQGGTLRLAIPEGCKVASVTGNKGDKLEKEGVLILETEKDKTVTVQYN